MGGTGTQTEVGGSGREGGISPTAVRAQLQRILASRWFAQSERLSRFLKTLVEAALDGRSDLNEYTIGIEVCERRESFDPRIDPLVRVHTRRLRSKLKQYYETEGADDTIEIELPLRTYTPLFRQRTPFEQQGLPSWSARSQAGNSLAIMYFTNLSSEEHDEYFAAGLTHELTHAFTRVKNLRVVVCPPATSLGPTRPDPREVGKLLQVHAVLVGTVRRKQDRFRVSAEVISVADGSILWAEMFEPEADDVVRIQQYLAHAICHGFRSYIEGQARR